MSKLEFELPILTTLAQRRFSRTKGESVDANKAAARAAVALITQDPTLNAIVIVASGSKGEDGKSLGMNATSLQHGSDFALDFMVENATVAMAQSLPVWKRIRLALRIIFTVRIERPPA